MPPQVVIKDSSGIKSHDFANVFSDGLGYAMAHKDVFATKNTIAWKIFAEAVQEADGMIEDMRASLDSAFTVAVASHCDESTKALMYTAMDLWFDYLRFVETLEKAKEAIEKSES